MPTKEGVSGLSTCYVFKSRLQEYAQKVGLPTPVYETIKEGPSHEPFFRSTVVVNDVRYDSLPGFSNRKAAEQSAAEVALLDLAKSGEFNPSISQPVHETGLCKNLLQEYAQKMNYAIPVYQFQKDDAPGRPTRFSCTVEIGGVRYIGAAGKTKKEAEIKAARTALLAIELPDKQVGDSQLSVVPSRKRAMETANNPKETENVSKTKKARYRKKFSKLKLSGENRNHPQDNSMSGMVVDMDGQAKLELNQTDSAAVQVSSLGALATEAKINCQDLKINIDQSEDMPSCASAPQVTADSKTDSAAVDVSVSGPLGAESKSHCQDLKLDIIQNLNDMPSAKCASVPQVTSDSKTESAAFEVLASASQVTADSKTDSVAIEVSVSGPLGAESKSHCQDLKLDIDQNLNDMPSVKCALVPQVTSDSKTESTAFEILASAPQVTADSKTDSAAIEVSVSGPLGAESKSYCQDLKLEIDQNLNDMPSVKCASVPQVTSDSKTESAAFEVLASAPQVTAASKTASAAGQASCSGPLPTEAKSNCQDLKLDIDQNVNGMPSVKSASSLQITAESKTEDLTNANANPDKGNHETPDMKVSSLVFGDVTTL